MATISKNATIIEVDYPTGDGKPMSETELHLWVMMDLIQTLAARYAADPMIYVGGDLLMYYEEGNPNKRLAPDIFVVRGVPKLPPRDNYLIWVEGKGPDLVIEVTSKTTKDNDQQKKLILYRDVLKVPEYFQFDPTEDYLHPAFQGFRLTGGNYRAIDPVDGRLPSDVLGLHLERSGTELRLYDPVLRSRVLTPTERAEAEAARAEAAEAESARLRREVEELRRRLTNGG